MDIHLQFLSQILKRDELSGATGTDGGGETVELRLWHGGSIEVW
jgi:hypothetical protein